MAAATDGALLAYVADMVTTIAKGVEEQHELQRGMATVLDLLLETNQAQSEMLSDVLTAASQEAGPSPVAEALKVLITVVEQMNDTQAILVARLAELPEAIGRQFEANLRAWRATAPATS